MMVKKPFTTTGTITGPQLKAARAWLDLSQDDLAAASMVARRAIQDFETGKGAPKPRTLNDLKTALEKKGIEFLFVEGRAVGIAVSAAAQKVASKD
jgi:DNA-binding XRE family transcriptional regulator